MNSTYNLALALLSFGVAVLASFVALTLAGRVGRARGGQARAWLIGGGLVLGTGIWAMHFIGMLAVYLPIRISYGVGETALSWLIAVAVSCFALLLVKGASLGHQRLAIGGV